MSTNFYMKDEISVRHIGKLVMAGPRFPRLRFLWAMHPAGMFARALRVEHDSPQDLPIVEDEYGRGLTLLDFAWRIVEAEQEYSMIGQEFS